MSKTAEGHVKSDIKRALANLHVYPFMEVAAGMHPDAAGTYFMPVAGPYSVHGIHDFVGCWSGVFFSIETKAPDNPDDETAHQGKFRIAFANCGGISVTGVRDTEAVFQIRDYVELKNAKILPR